MVELCLLVNFFVSYALAVAHDVAVWVALSKSLLRLARLTKRAALLGRVEVELATLLTQYILCVAKVRVTRLERLA